MMKKKGFILIYVLILLAALTITTEFATKRGLNRAEFKSDLFNKKTASYQAESAINIAQKSESDREIFNGVLDRFKDGDNFTFNANKSVKIPYDGKYIKVSYKVLKDGSLKISCKSDLKDSTGNAEEREEVNGLEFFPFDLKGSDFKAHYKNGIEVKEGTRLDKRIKDLELKKYNRKPYKETMDEGFCREKGDLTIGGESKEENSKDKDFPDTGEEGSNEKDQPEEKELEGKKFNGILFVDGDLTLKKDFEIDGILILKGKLKDDGRKRKLTVNGEMIYYQIPDSKIIDFHYKGQTYLQYLYEIKGFADLKTIYKRVY